MVFAVGVSVAVPDACELVVTVRVVDPAAAVIVTDVAFKVCQLIETLCPELMAVGVTLNFVTCGAADDTVTFAVAGVLDPAGPVAVAV